MIDTNPAIVSGTKTSVYVSAGHSSTTSAILAPEGPAKRAKAPPKKLVDAVYAHVRALRSLGQTRINTADIADALSLNRREVERAISALEDRGVRTIK